MDIARQLDSVNDEVGRRLAACENYLRELAAEFQAFRSSRVFSILDPTLRTTLEASVRAYADSNMRRLHAAKAGFEATRALVAPAQQVVNPPPQDAFDMLLSRTPETVPVALPQAISTPPSVLQPARRLGMAPDTSVEEAEGGEWESVLSQQEQQENLDVEETQPASAPASASGRTTLPGGTRGRPAPRESRGSASPVRSDGVVRASGPDDSDAPQVAPGRMRQATARKLGGATVRAVGRDEILSGSVPTADEGAGDGVVSARPTSPDADYDAIVKSIKNKQRAVMTKQASGGQAPLIREAEVIDQTGSTVGRASGIERDRQQLTADRVELFLDSIEGNWTEMIAANDAVGVLRAIAKSRAIWVFQGATTSVSAMIANANAVGFDEADDHILILETVMLVNAGATR